MSYDNTNKGVLFKSEKKTDKHPDYTGSINIAGTEHWLSAWINKSERGVTYMSLSIGDEKKPLGSEKPVSNVGSNERPDFDDDIPF